MSQTTNCTSPHLDSIDLSQFADASLPPERMAEVQAHLDACLLCRDQLEQCQSDGEFFKRFTPLVQGEANRFPPAIDALVLPQLESRLSPSGRAKFTPNTTRSHPDAPLIPNYVLLRPLGTGAFGVVWEAEDQLGGRCAVKVLDQRHADYDLAGIQQSKQLKLPGLVAIWHVGQTDDGNWHYVMDLVPRTLAADLQRRGKLPAPEARAVVVELLAVLAGCHQAGLAHRDIKPENIGFTETDRLVLLDLGLVTEARRTHRTLVGTPDYMPHKPSETAALDDLYAVGMVLYCLLTGEKPTAPIPAKPVGLAPLRGLELQLYRAARRATAPAPSERFQSITGFLKAVTKRKSRVRKSGGLGIISEATAGAEANPATDQNPNDSMQASIQTIKELLTQAATVFGDIGQTQRLQLIRLETEKLGRPRYKIVIVGQFKSGKSTLINQVLLREDLLFADLMEATAVPTEIECSDQKYLEVYPRRVQTDTLTVGAGDTARTVQVEVGLDATAPVRTLNPTPEDIKRATTADDAEGRARLARETARVRIGWPAPALAEFTFVDTAGINSINEALVETTYRLIPEADVVIFVTPARQLDQVDRAFLRGRVFADGVSRCMVVVNHNSKHASLTPAQLEHIRADVRADLKSIGRPHIPVESINLGGEAEHRESVDAFRSKLQLFLAENVLPGRIERSQNVLRRELAQARLECAAELAALQKTPTERHAILNKLQVESRELERRYNRLVDALIADLKIIHEEHLKGLDLGMDRIRDEYLAGLRACDGLAAMQKTLEAAPSLLKAPAENMFFSVAADTRKRVAQLEEKYDANLREATTPWQRAITAQLGVGDDLVTTVLKKTPPPVLTVIDVLLSDFLMIGGVIWGVIWRFVFSKLPVIRDFLPSNLFKSALVAWIEREITAQFAKTKAQLRENAAGVFQKVEDQVRTAWMEHMNAQTTGVTGAVEATLGAPKDQARHNLLQASGQRLDELLRQSQ